MAPAKPEKVVYARPVHFEDVDAAGIVFFARFLNYCHEAMERFFDGAPVGGPGGHGGYVELIMKRKIGFPTVHIACDFRSPLRYGDVANIEVQVTNVGTSSCAFRYVITRASDGNAVASIDHVVVATDLKTVVKVDLPADARTLLESHLVREPTAATAAGGP